MKIDPAHLTSLRNEYSLLSYGPRCFAIIWSPDSFLHDVTSFIEKINMYNPHRIHLDLSGLNDNSTTQAFVVVEMKYRTPIHQKYFTFLMWQLSKNVSAWIHIWDTMEHDALRRDFTAPSYMDSELSINRLWLKQGSVFLLNFGYSEDNPHGEFVPDIDLERAIDCLQSGKSIVEESLSTQLQEEFNEKGDSEHLLEHVSDVTSVYIPKSLVKLVSQNPHWITYPDFDEMDPTQIVLDAIPSSVSLTDEIPYTVATSDMAYGDTSNEDFFQNSMTRAQWLSLAIKFNANKAFQDVSKNTAEIPDFVPFSDTELVSQDFSSAFLMQKLYNVGLATKITSAKVQTCSDQQMIKSWDEPVCVLNKDDIKVYEKLQRQEFQANGTDTDSESESENESESESDILTENNAPFFTGLEDTREFSRKFTKKDIWNKLSAAVEDPEVLDGAQAFSEGDLAQTADLEDFDDFVEYYAKHFLGYNDEDLKKHQVQNPKPTGEEESKKDFFDWQIYNDDSEYESDYKSEDEVEI